MGAIKDIVDLTVQLLDRVDARKFSGEIMKIQSLAGSLQLEHATIIEKDIHLAAENEEWKRKFEESERNCADKISTLMKSHLAEISRLNKRQLPPQTEWYGPSPGDFHGVM